MASVDSTKFFFSFRLEATGQVLEYTRTEISGDSAKQLFRLAALYKQVMFPKSIKEDREIAAKADAERQKAKRTKVKKVSKASKTPSRIKVV